MAATAPDLILLNADIRTMDPLLLRARALAVRKGRITALGDADEIRGLANGRTRKVDAGGRLVLPGFQDTHSICRTAAPDSPPASISQARGVWRSCRIW